MPFEFEYVSYDGYPDLSSTIMREYGLDDLGAYQLFRTTYTDMEELGNIPYMVNRAVEDTNNKRWVWHYEYDEVARRVVREFQPSAMDSYTPGDSQAEPVVLPEYVAKEAGGLVYQYDYDEVGNRNQVAIRSADGTTFEVVQETDFSVGEEALGRTDLIMEMRKYRVAGSALDDDIEVTTYEYGVYDDDPQMLRRQANATGGAIEQESFQLTDRQFSVIAVLDETGALMERVAYDPYGRGQHRWPADFNNDGYVDSGDTSPMALFTPIEDPAYLVDEDLDRNGAIDIDDLVIAAGVWSTRGPLAAGQISDPEGPANGVGYAGYRFEPASSLSHVRFRWYDTGLGRWMERDPAGYVDGNNLLQYVKSTPVSVNDHTGLSGASVETIQCFRDKNCGRLRQSFSEGKLSIEQFNILWTNQHCGLGVKQEVFEGCVSKCFKDLGGDIGMFITGADIIAGASTAELLPKRRLEGALGAPSRGTSLYSEAVHVTRDFTSQNARHTARAAGRAVGKATPVVLTAAGGYTLGLSTSCRTECADEIK